MSGKAPTTAGALWRPWRTPSAVMNVLFFHSVAGEVIEDFHNIGLPTWAIKPRAGAAPKERLVAQGLRWIDGINCNLLERASIAARRARRTAASPGP